MRYIILLVLVLSSSAYAQGCFGPVCAGPQPAEPVGPIELCFPDGCEPVLYRWFDRFMIASSLLVNGYEVIGWSGPCDQSYCPDIKNQAFADLELNAKRANRAQRYGD